MMQENKIEIYDYYACTCKKFLLKDNDNIMIYLTQSPFLNNV